MMPLTRISFSQSVRTCIIKSKGRHLLSHRQGQGGRTRPGDRVRPLFAQSGGKEAGEQGHQHHANDGDTRARHELLHSL